MIKNIISSYFSSGTHPQTERLFCLWEAYFLFENLHDKSHSIAGWGWRSASLKRAQLLSKEPSSVSGTQEMANKWYFPPYVCMIKLPVNSRSLFSTMVYVNNPCLRPQGTTSFWFAGIHKCKSHWILGKREAAILASWDQSLAPSRVVSVAAFLVPQKYLWTRSRANQAHPLVRSEPHRHHSASWLAGN